MTTTGPANTGRRPASPVRAYLFGAVAVAVSLVVAVLLYRAYGRTEVGFGPRGYVVESDSRVQVAFDVDKRPQSTALCTVRARDVHGAEVGVALVRVPPAPQRHVVVRHELVTTGRAVTGEVVGCTLERAVSSPSASP